MCMADYLSRQLSPSNNNAQVKQKNYGTNGNQLLHNSSALPARCYYSAMGALTNSLPYTWFCLVNKIKSEKTVLYAQSRREKEIQPITAVFREKSDRTDRDGMASETALSKQEQ